MWGNALSNNAVGSLRSNRLIKKFFHILANPIKYFWWKRHPAAKVILKLFQSWEDQNVEVYMTSWHANAIQIAGSGAEIKIDEIKANFIEKIGIYRKTQPRIVLLDELESEEVDSVLVFMFYQFFLIRTADGMPILEEAYEVYRLKKFGIEWKITHNYDHFVAVKK